MSTPSIQIDVTFAWWLQPWIKAVVFFAVVTGSEPDWAKVQRMVTRAMRIKVKGAQR